MTAGSLAMVLVCLGLAGLAAHHALPSPTASLSAAIGAIVLFVVAAILSIPGVA